MKTLTFQLTQAQFDSKLTEMKKEVGDDLDEITTYSGVVKHSGVSAHYAYDTAAQVLTVNIDHKPFIVPESTIDTKLEEWFKA